MDLGTAFAFSVEREPGADALVDGAQRRSYGQWYGEIRAVAGGLRRMGLRAGDHLVVSMRNRAEMATLYWASHLLGLIFTPVSWRAGVDEMAYCIEDAEAAAIAYDGAARQAAPEAAARLRFPGEKQIVAADGRGDGIGYDRLLDGPVLAGPVGADDEAICLMLYTSGTTGRPKGVPRSHRAELAAGVSQVAHHRYRPGDSALAVMPMFHTMGVRTLLSSALINGKVVCMPDYSPAELLRLVESERLSSLFLVPTMFHDVLREPAFETADLRSLSRVGYAGMTMAPALVERCVDRLRPEVFINHYGSSEIYTFTICDHPGAKPGCAGRAGLNQVIRVVAANPDRRDEIGADLPPGEPGEIVASMASPEAFTAYWKRPDADAKAIQGGWYRTGDLGRFDEDGELYVVGRVDDMIISGGENIFPEEIEDALVRCSLVAGVAVVGMPDERLGSRVVAFVEPAHAGVKADELDRACLRSGLARFKRPREYVFVKSIPRSASGKLLRRKLRIGEYEPFSPISSEQMTNTG
jgi:2-furoate---CoA ligase